jgi:hypothetical protein
MTVSHRNTERIPNTEIRATAEMPLRDMPQVHQEQPL